MRLNQQDFLNFNQAVAKLYRMARTTGPLNAIAHTLQEQIGGLAVSVGVFGPSLMDCVLLGLDQREMEAALPVELLMTHPRCSRPELLGQVVTISDLLSLKDWRMHPLYLALPEKMRNDDDMGIDALLPKERLMRACVVRKKRTFTQRDRQIMLLLLPHMLCLLDTDNPAIGSPVSIPIPDDAGLTKREKEVLIWLSEGKTNREIAQILNIAVGTVRIHLEHIYKKLGVENRQGATRRALEHLLEWRSGDKNSRPEL